MAQVTALMGTRCGVPKDTYVYILTYISCIDYIKGSDKHFLSAALFKILGDLSSRFLYF